MSNSNSASLAELDRRIAIVRDNIRQLVEQAAGFSGAADEERNADRLAQQNEELERLRASATRCRRRSAANSQAREDAYCTFSDQSLQSDGDMRGDAIGLRVVRVLS